MNLKADAVGAAEQFHHQYDLPDQGQAGAAGSGDKGKELRQHDVAQQLEAREAKCLRHLHEVGIKRERALAQGDHDIGDLVQRYCGQRRRLGEADPDVAEYRQRVVQGQSMSVRVDLGGRRLIKKITTDTIFPMMSDVCNTRSLTLSTFPTT